MLCVCARSVGSDAQEPLDAPHGIPARVRRAQVALVRQMEDARRVAGLRQRPLDRLHKRYFVLGPGVEERRVHGDDVVVLRRPRIRGPDVRRLREADGHVLREGVVPSQQYEMRRPIQKSVQPLPVEMLREELESDHPPVRVLPSQSIEELLRPLPASPEGGVVHGHVPREPVLAARPQILLVKRFAVHDDVAVRPQHLHQ
mmetsp:Transcript_27395/g.70922  ORF Transcript_27395/g.70922 Transcript_27395/m.70922 type:complete len:201 (-) Transcript_27395:289-891(-)